MEHILTLLRHSRARSAKRWTDHICQELDEVQNQLRCVESLFNMTVDSQIIEGCCAQRIALYARYDRLLREARKQGVRRNPY